MACYRSLLRNGHDRPMATLHDRRGDMATFGTSEDDTGGETLTLGEWSRYRGYDQAERCYL